MKTAIVTGAGSGIGRAVALRLSADGYRVAVNDIRAAASEGVVAEIRSRKGEAIAVGGDVSKEDDVAAIVAAYPDVHVLRDPTRGGLASALNEIAAASRVGVDLHEETIPIPGPVLAACEMLGLDPLHVEIGRAHV